MKIAIASNGKDENSEVSPVGARAPFFLIFEDKKLTKTITNPFRVGGGGAGFSVAQMLANEKVEMVVAGRIGPNMEMALKEKGIEIKQVENKTVKQVLEGIV